MSARSVAGRVARAVGIRQSTSVAVRARFERELIAARRHRGAPPRNRILCYHSVGTPEWGINDVSPAHFRRQLESALDAGYTFLPADQLSPYPTNGERCLAVTFDDGTRSTATNAAPILADLGIPWTVFVVSAWAEGKHESGPELFLDWRDIEELAAAGVTIGSHSVTHPDFGQLDARAAACELFESREVIRRRTGLDADEFAIPFGLAKNWTTMAADAAREPVIDASTRKRTSSAPPIPNRVRSLRASTVNSSSGRHSTARTTGGNRGTDRRVVGRATHEPVRRWTVDEIAPREAGEAHSPGARPTRHRAAAPSRAHASGPRRETRLPRPIRLRDECLPRRTIGRATARRLD